MAVGPRGGGKGEVNLLTGDQTRPGPLARRIVLRILLRLLRSSTEAQHATKPVRFRMRQSSVHLSDGGLHFCPTLRPIASMLRCLLQLSKFLVTNALLDPEHLLPDEGAR